MMASPRLGFNEAVALTVIFLSVKVMISHLALMFPLGLSATWMIPLMHLPVGLIGFAVLAWLLNQFPGRTIIEIGEELVGPALNIFFALVIYVFFTGGSALVLRQSAEFMLTDFFPDTPISVVAATYMVGAALIVYLGLETLGRVARIAFPFLIIGLALLILLTANLWQPHGIYPLWGPGILELSWVALSTLGVGVEIFFLALAAPYLPQGRLLPIGLISVLAAGLVVAAVILASLLVFPYPVVQEWTLPVFAITRAIEWGGFFVRMETLFLPLWVFSALLAHATALYLSVATAARALKLPYHRPFILPTVVLILAAAFVPPNFPAAMDWGFAFLVRWSFIFLGVIVAVLVAAALLRKRQQGKGGKTGRRPGRRTNHT